MPPTRPSLPTILLMGPTASGKTALAITLAQQFPVDIISVDSAMVYRDMNIGTAKPDAVTLAAAPHQLIDLISPLESYSAAQFCTDAFNAITQSHARGRIPLLVGGTMLYFKALREGLSQLPAANGAIRAQIDAEAEQFGWEHCHRELLRHDPESARRLNPTDTQRIQRALEVFRITGKTLSELWAQGRSRTPDFRWQAITLMPSERSVLHSRIAQRFEQMLAAGLLTELEYLRQQYALHADLPAMRCVGYRQAWAYQEGEYDYSTLRNRGIFATRQLAKRQMTWLRNMPDTHTLDCLSPQLHTQCIELISEFLATTRTPS